MCASLVTAVLDCLHQQGQNIHLVGQNIHLDCLYQQGQNIYLVDVAAVLSEAVLRPVAAVPAGAAAAVVLAAVVLHTRQCSQW